MYRTITPGTEFLTSPDPGPLIIRAGSTRVNSGNINRDHLEACREHKEWVNLDCAGKKEITESVTKTFLAGVFDQNRVFAHISVREIIAHLFAEYVQVEYQNLVGNRSKLADPWDKNRPFQEIVQQFQEIKEFTNDGGS